MRADSTPGSSSINPIAGLLSPDGVVLVGGINRSRTARDLEAELRPRFGDRWYLVSPKGGHVDHIPIYESLEAIPAPVDLAVIRTPAAATVATMEACGRIGVRYAVVFASGFAESGPAGETLQRRLEEAARAAGIRVLGPNTNFNAFEPQPEPPHPFPGKVAVLSQSGFQGRAVTNAQRHNLPVVREVALGNEIDLSVNHFLEHYAADPEVSVVAAYIEGFHDGAFLGDALAACAATDTAVVVLKPGSTPDGSRMAHAHTAHRTGDDGIVDAILTRHAAVRVDDLDELRETTALLSAIPRSTGPRAALYSVSGGTCTHMAEVASMESVPVPPLSEATQAELHTLIPDFLTVSNPIDNGGAFVMGDDLGARRRAIEVIAADASVDILVVGFPAASTLTSDNLAADVSAAAHTLPIPVVAVWSDPTTDEIGFRALVEARIPIFRSFRGCFRALARHDARRRGIAGRRSRPSLTSGPLRAALRSAVENPEPLTGSRGRDLLAASGYIPASTVVRPVSEHNDRGIAVIIKSIADPDLGYAIQLATGGCASDLIDDAVVVSLPMDRGDAIDALGATQSARRFSQTGPPSQIVDTVLALAAVVEAAGPSLTKATVHAQLADDLLALDVHLQLTSIEEQR